VVDQAPLGRLIVLRGVTEERMLDRLRDDLTDTLVHDLRNPLTAISGALELLEAAAEVGPRLQEVVRIARASSERMFGLVTGILDLSRLENGSMPLAPGRLDLATMVGEALALQQPLTGARRVSLVSEVPDALPPAWADPSLVSRVLQNLVGNAVKFLTDGGTVTVAARLDARDQSMLEVRVADTGPGIDPGLQPRLFHKFVSGQQQGHGSGLGLAFCRLAVEAHGGRIWVDSVPGRGAVFAFTLPVAPTDSAPATGAAPGLRAS
jgi:two-component system, NtrC family, sensor histidine kinase KinB